MNRREASSLDFRRTFGELPEFEKKKTESMKRATRLKLFCDFI